MSQRRRSRARRDPDLDDAASPARRRSDDEDEEGNEDLTLEIVARAARRREAAGGKSGPAEVISLSSDEEVDEDAVVELGDADPRRKKDKKKKRRKEKRKKQRKEEDAAAADDKEEVAGTQEGQNGISKPVLIEDGVDAPVSDNTVLRKLLRIPRYFDPGETILETCFNCGEEGHVAVNCPMEKRKKPCFVCGLFGHNAKACKQGQDCFICKKGGHMAKDCPDKHIQNTQQCTLLCLRCGETGHDMFGCSNDYPPDEVKEIKCYVCKQNGHLCCTDFSDSCLKEVTCYNCAQSGHTGLGCAKQRRETSVATTPTLCYKCGEDGHFARGCTNSAKPGRFKGGESSSHSRRKEKWKNDSGHRSSPHGAHKRKSPLFEDRWETPRGNSRVRGGWIPDDHDDLPYKKYKANGWGGSSSTPKKPYNNHHHKHSSGGDYSTPRGQDYSWHNSQYSPSARKHGSSSSSRFNNNTHLHFERS